MIELTIDGKKVQTQEGVTVLRAAQQAGIHIPNLCDHPAVTPYGGCRLCIVEVDGMRLPIASCTLPAANGMVVKTNTEALQKTRRFILSMLFSERNHFCPYCQVSGGDCELQNAAYHEGMTHWPIQPTWKVFPVDTSHPYIILDNNRCILCRRCVRACEELVGVATWGIEARGSESLLMADTGVPFGESTCVSCGTCVQVCPTGALIDKESAYLGLEENLITTSTLCVGCSVGCGIQAYSRDNNLVRIDGDWLAPVNQGVLCELGRYQALQRQEARLEHPMIRQDGQLKQVSWEDALEFAASQLRPILQKTENGLAALVSTRLPVEDLAAFEDFFRNGLKSGLVTSIEEGFTFFAEQTRQEVHEFPLEGNLEDLKGSDGILIVGTNLSDYHQVAGFIIRRQTLKGNTLVIIDPNNNHLDDMTQHQLKTQTGNDIIILNQMAKIIGQLPTGEVSVATGDEEQEIGIPFEKILAAAKDLAACRKVTIIFGKGITTHNNPAMLTALRDLALALGKANGQPATILSVKGKANSLAADLLNLNQVFEVKKHQAAYILLGDDQLSERQLRVLEETPLIVVQAAYHSALTEIADIVLPVTNWTEQEGHYLNLEGRTQKATRIFEVPSHARTNSWVLENLANRLGIPLNNQWQERISHAPAVVRLELGAN